MQFLQPGTQPTRVLGPSEICRIAGHVDRHALLEHVERPAQHCIVDVRVDLAQRCLPLTERLVEVGVEQLVEQPSIPHLGQGHGGPIEQRLPQPGQGLTRRGLVGQVEGGRVQQIGPTEGPVDIKVGGGAHSVLPDRLESAA